MKIGIDGFEANISHRVGIGQYAYHMISQMVALGSSHQFKIFLPSDPLPDMPKAQNIEYVIGSKGALWTVRKLPFLIRKNQVDVFFSPTHYIPSFTNIPIVCAIMDLSYLHYPYLFKKKDLLQLRFMGGYAIKHARKIFTISSFSKTEIVRYYHRSEQDVIITYPGINDQNSYTSATDVQKKYGLSRKYILFVGTLQPRKNIERLVAAFETLGENLDLVIVGKKGWLYEPILSRINSSPKKPAIKMLSYVPDQDLPDLYRYASCFALPSLYEGFGIPVVDAIRNSCVPVISQTSSLPEIAGKAGIYVDPLSVSSIAKGLEKAVQLEPSAKAAYISAGQKHIQQFNWENAALRALSIFERLYDQ